MVSESRVRSRGLDKQQSSQSDLSELEPLGQMALCRAVKDFRFEEEKMAARPRRKVTRHTVKKDGILRKNEASARARPACLRRG